MRTMNPDRRPGCLERDRRSLAQREGVRNGGRVTAYATSGNQSFPEAPKIRRFILNYLAVQGRLATHKATTVVEPALLKKVIPTPTTRSGLGVAVWIAAEFAEDARVTRGGHRQVTFVQVQYVGR